MADMNKTPENLLDLARNKGLIRPCDLAPLGIPRVSLTRAVRSGQLERVGRGSLWFAWTECLSPGIAGGGVTQGS